MPRTRDTAPTATPDRRRGPYLIDPRMTPEITQRWEKM